VGIASIWDQDNPNRAKLNVADDTAAAGRCVVGLRSFSSAIWVIVGIILLFAPCVIFPAALALETTLVDLIFRSITTSLCVACTASHFTTSVDHFLTWGAGCRMLRQVKKFCVFDVHVGIPSPTSGIFIRLIMRPPRHFGLRTNILQLYGRAFWCTVSGAGGGSRRPVPLGHNQRLSYHAATNARWSWSGLAARYTMLNKAEKVKSGSPIHERQIRLASCWEGRPPSSAATLPPLIFTGGQSCHHKH